VFTLLLPCGNGINSKDVALGHGKAKLKYGGNGRESFVIWKGVVCVSGLFERAIVGL
jgi:hypothetical protein